MYKKFLLMMAFPVIVILGLLAFKLFTVVTGEDIVLETRPVDPIDLFRGRYVALRYQISELNLDGYPAGGSFQYGDTIYATLSKKDEYWDIDNIFNKKPSLADNQVCLRGNVRYSYGSTSPIDWGIESFFLPEDKAKEVESQRWAGNLTSAVVTVDQFCNPVLKSLIVGGETVTIN